MISKNQVHREFKTAANVYIYWNHCEKIEMMIIDWADKVIIIVLGSVFSRKINLNKFYINSPVSIKSKTVLINPINKDDNKCFQYAATWSSNYKETGKKLKTNIKN